jgi:hypothetical protein
MYIFSGCRTGIGSDLSDMRLQMFLPREVETDGLGINLRIRSHGGVEVKQNRSGLEHQLSRSQLSCSSLYVSICHTD